MKNKLIDIVPYVLTGKMRSKEDLFTMTEKWTSQRVEKEISNVEERYRLRTKEEITGYSGLLMFSEIIKLFQQIDHKSSSQNELILRAQKRVLYYHNIQYESTESNGKKS